jgi:PPK2 family polyphosphate:nucleotide phosphotransferase
MIATMKISHIIRQIRIDRPETFRLAACDPKHTHGIEIGKEAAQAHLADDIKRLADLQERLWAENRWAVLVVLQGMDASGKDGIIKHVMAGINPQGCEVHSFKTPTSEELDHDFLWRHAIRLPERGRIGIFNRSYYEEVLIVRVHPEVLAREKLPKQVITPRIWQQRFEDIRTFERTLAHNGVLVLKFFLHISKDEQRRRFLDRLDEPSKRWKLSMSDIAERKLWDRYMTAYQDMLRATSHAAGRWHVVPADHKPFARLIVAGAMVEALDRLDLAFPQVKGAALAQLGKVREALLAEKVDGKRRRQTSRTGAAT